jgi:uncharacterized membrane protein
MAQHHTAQEEDLSDRPSTGGPTGKSADRSAGRSSARRSQSEIDNLTWGELRDWMQLVRLPNVFTLLSDCVAAAIVAAGLAWPVTAFVPVLFASLLAYWAGMILNDVVDLEEDREHRPDRPLPAGRISPVIAGHIASGMLLIGPIVILAVMAFHTSQPLWMGIAFLAAVLLSLSVRVYDSPLKRTPLGPPLMGLCRGLNILMVGFAMLAVTQVAGLEGEQETLAASANVVDKMLIDPLLPQEDRALEVIAKLPDVIFPRPLMALAAGIGLYIFGVTVYARREERESSSAVLLFGILLEIAGLVIIGCLPIWADAGQVWTLNPRQGYPLLVGLIGLTVVNRGLAGVWHPVPRKVQLAVKHAILTLILIDAAVVLMWAGPWYGCAVVALLLPALSSAIRYRST